MKSRRTVILPCLLLLVATHGAVFLLARSGMGLPDDAGEVRDASYPAPAKSADRDPAGTATGSSFARRLRELEDSTLQRHDFELAREALFREWILRDLRGVMDQLYGPEHRKGYRDLAEALSAELAAEIVRQPQAVWDWLSTRRFGTGGPQVFSLWCEALARAGETDFLLDCLQADPLFTDDDTISRLCAKIPAGDAAQLAKLRKLVGSLSPWAAGRAAESYAERMAKEAGLDPVPFLSAEPDEKIRGQFLEEWAWVELAHLPVAEQVKAIAALPEPYRAEGADSMVHHSRGDTKAAVALINAMDAGGLLGDPAGDAARELAKSALNWVMEDSFTTALDSVHALQEIHADPLRRQALENFGSLFDHRAPAPMQDCVEALPEGADRDAFISGVVWRAKMSPEAREELLDAIQDPQVAAEARGKVKEILDQEAKREREKAKEKAADGSFVLPE